VTTRNDQTLQLSTPSTRHRVAGWISERGAALHFLVWTAAGVVYSTYLAGLAMRRMFWRIVGPPPMPPA